MLRPWLALVLLASSIAIVYFVDRNTPPKFALASDFLNTRADVDRLKEHLARKGSFWPALETYIDSEEFADREPNASTVSYEDLEVDFRELRDHVLEFNPRTIEELKAVLWLWLLEQPEPTESEFEVIDHNEPGD